MSGPLPLLVQTFALAPVAAVNDIRVHQPSAAMAGLPGVRCHVVGPGEAPAPAREGEGRVFIWQRQILDPANAGQHLGLIAAGHLVISEWDDDPRLWPKVTETGFFCLRASHAVQTSTETLAALIRRHNPEVAVFRNELAEIPPERPVEPERRALTIVFAALNREPDWAPIMPVLNEVLARYGERVRVQVVHDRRFFEALATPHKAFEPTCGHDRYRALLAQADIALLPLGDRPSNHMKSDLKFIECAAEGVAVLASPVVYEQTVRHGETGLIYRTPAQFGLRLRALIGDPALRRQLTAAAYAYVARERRLADHVARRVEWYRSLLARRTALTGAVAERCPEIAPALG